MFSLSHIFGSEKKEAKAQFIEKNLFQKHSISLEEQALKKKVKIEKTDEFNENFDKIPLIRDYDPELDESNPIKIITSINLITNKQNCKKNSLFQETKKQEIKEETIEKIEKNSKIKNNFEEIQSFMSIYDIYFNNMFFVPDFKNLFNMRKYFEDRI